jgi:hypothetical protein
VATEGWQVVSTAEDRARRANRQLRSAARCKQCSNADAEREAAGRYAFYDVLLARRGASQQKLCSTFSVPLRVMLKTVPSPQAPP